MTFLSLYNAVVRHLILILGIKLFMRYISE